MVLLLHADNYRVNNPQKFNPSFDPLNSYTTSNRIVFLSEYKGLRKYIQNPTSSLRDKGLVYPNLRIDERMRGSAYSCDLKVSFSCPKILWGHSFEEVTDSYFPQIVETLAKRLLDMDVIVTSEAISNAIVHTLHYCANISFPSEADARLFLTRLNKTSIGSWFENNTKIYSNNGHAVRFHTDIFEIVFYLKYYDALETSNKSVGRKTTLQEKETAKRLLSEGKIPPVIRMEIRLNGTRSVRTHLLATTGVERQYWTFQEVFNSVQSRSVQRYYWDKIIGDPINYAYLSTTLDEDICQKVLEKYKGERLKYIAEAMGLFYFLKSMGTKGTRDAVVLRQSRKTWYEKRKKIIGFARRFTKPDTSLIDIVTKVLESKPIQLGLPI